MRFAQGVDRRVGHLGEILAEIVKRQARALAQHRKRRIVAHRADRFLAVLTKHTHDAFQLFAVV